MTHYITKEGLEDLKRELKELEEKKIPEALEAINVALAEGDIKENSALDSARLERDKLEFRKNELEDVLSNYELIEEDKGDSKSKRIQIGSQVRVEYVDSNDVFDLKIVGVSEADAVNGKISNESPLAKAVLGKKEKDEVDVKINHSTTVKVKILEILS